ncbi:hypothetical protein D9756_001854 [Leucocoprinus leucothites]|uniref:Uncharacterized protein n=1 Tax=Leucocoprinus leucothites TaxID=201217 RepID=A0A8H5G4L5_9AGAR|nr:hypothetical protein D9756_001854 [Leucoagaricus leucothites]
MERSERKPIASFKMWLLMDIRLFIGALISVMLIANVITLLTLLVLLLVEFRVWLDVAREQRVHSHFGGHGFIARTNVRETATSVPALKAEMLPREAGDQQGICDIIALHILITSWIIPVLLLIYLTGLAIRVYRRRPVVGLSTDRSKLGSEGTLASPTYMHSARPSLLPIMNVSQTPISLKFPPEVHSKPRQSISTRRSAISVSSRYSSLPTTPTSGNPARLSKRSPLADFWILYQVKIIVWSVRHLRLLEYDSMSSFFGVVQPLAAPSMQPSAVSVIKSKTSHVIPKLGYEQISLLVVMSACPAEPGSQETVDDPSFRV